MARARCNDPCRLTAQARSWSWFAVAIVEIAARWTQLSAAASRTVASTAAGSVRSNAGVSNVASGNATEKAWVRYRPTKPDAPVIRTRPGGLVMSGTHPGLMTRQIRLHHLGDHLFQHDR